MNQSFILFLTSLSVACGGKITTESPSLVESEDAQEEDKEVEESEPSSQSTDEPANEPSSQPEDEPSSEPSQDPVTEEQIVFEKRSLFTLPGTSWMEPADLDNDGFMEYLVTSMTVGVGDWPSFIGAGAAHIVSRDGGAPEGILGTWSADVVFDRSFEVDWPNDSSLFDVNNDGIPDWVIGTGFIPLPNGGITWMPGVESASGDLSFEIPDIIPVPREEYFYHKAYPLDMDGDGDIDFVTSSYKNAATDWFGNVTEPGIAVLEWFENDGIAGQASFTHHFISENGGTFVKTLDVDEDGDLDLVLPQYFGGASLVWLENPSSMTQSWVEHVINDNTGKGFDVKITDMNNDGVKDIVYVNHNHQSSTDPEEQVMGVYWFEVPPASTLDSLSNWDSTMNVVYEGFFVDEADPDRNGAPGIMHVGDVDGDGLMDISVSGDGDDGLYLFHQQADQTFEEILIDTGTSMAGDHHMADLDGDGDMDFIWAIYGSQNIFNGEFEPQSEINVYLQGTETVVGDRYQGDLDFVIETSFGPDTCSGGSVDLVVNGNSVSGTYSCAFGTLGTQNQSMRGTVDSNGNITGELDLTVSFANATYQIEWQGAYDGNRITGSTDSSATLGSFDIDYTLSFTAE